MTTLVDALRRGAAEHDGVRVVMDGARPYDGTVGDLMTDAERAAGALEALGVAAGATVAVALPNSAEAAAVQAAVGLTGATLLPLVASVGPHDLGDLLRRSQASVLLMLARRPPHDGASLLAAAGPLPDLRTVVTLGEPTPAGTLSWDDLLARARTPAFPTVGPDERALLVYTSGTTAAPKGVQHSHASLLAEVGAPLLERDAGPDSVQLAVFPTGHVAGLLGLLRILVGGTAAVVMDTWSPERAATLVDRHRVTSSVGAPIHLGGLLDARDAGRADLCSLREYMVGAAGVPRSLMERAEAAGVRAYRCYGSTEHPTISCGAPDDPLAARAGTDGRPTLGTEVRLIGADGADGPEGEIVTRGPELFIGYTEPSPESWLDGRWFRTGDVGRIDDDGLLTVTDRIKDIIVRGGENLSSAEIEGLLARHPAVAEVAAVAIPDPRYGERVCAVVVAHGALTLEDVTAHFAAAGVDRRKTPERLVLVDGLPRTAAGKVRKHVLRAQLIMET